MEALLGEERGKGKMKEAAVRPFCILFFSEDSFMIAIIPQHCVHTDASYYCNITFINSVRLRHVRM